MPVPPRLPPRPAHACTQGAGNGPRRDSMLTADVLLGLYRDPSSPQAAAAGVLFDAVSVPLPLGLDALEQLLCFGEPVGPVAADGRGPVRRVAFLLDPGVFTAVPALVWWCRRHALRTVSHGDVVLLPALIPDPRARVRWLVAPGPVPAAGTQPAALLGCLRRALAREHRAEAEEGRAGHVPRSRRGC